MYLPILYNYNCRTYFVTIQHPRTPHSTDCWSKFHVFFFIDCYWVEYPRLSLIFLWTLDKIWAAQLPYVEAQPSTERAYWPLFGHVTCRASHARFVWNFTSRTIKYTDSRGHMTNCEHVEWCLILHVLILILFLLKAFSYFMFETDFFQLHLNISFNIFQGAYLNVWI